MIVNRLDHIESRLAKIEIVLGIAAREIIESGGESREREKPAKPQASIPEAPLTDGPRKGPSGTAALDAQSLSNRDVSTDGKPCLGDASQGNHPMPAQDAGELAGREGHSESAAGPDVPEPTTVGNPVAILTMPDIPAAFDMRRAAAE